jgi:hypothetical protein
MVKKNLTHVWSHTYDRYYTSTFEFLSQDEHEKRISCDEYRKYIAKNKFNSDADWFGIDEHTHMGSYDGDADKKYIIIVDPVDGSSEKMLFLTDEPLEFIKNDVLVDEKECKSRMAKRREELEDDEEIDGCDKLHSIPDTKFYETLFCCTDKYDGEDWYSDSGFRIINLDEKYPETHSEWQNLFDNPEIPLLIYVKRLHPDTNFQAGT